MPPPLTRATLEEFGHIARQQFETVRNNCWYVNRRLKEKLIYLELSDRFEPASEYIDIVWICATNRDGNHPRDHAVLFLDEALVTDALATTEPVLVDAALDQFNTENAEARGFPFALGQRPEIDSVVIAPHDDPRRKQIYHEHPVNVDTEQAATYSLPL